MRNAAGIDDVAMRGPDTGEILFLIDLATVHAFRFFFLFCVKLLFRRNTNRDTHSR